MYNLSAVISGSSRYTFVGGSAANTFTVTSSSFNMSGAYSPTNYNLSIYSGSTTQPNQTFIGAIFYLTFDNAAFELST